MTHTRLDLWTYTIAAVEIRDLANQRTYPEEDLASLAHFKRVGFWSAQAGLTTANPTDAADGVEPAR